MQSTIPQTHSNIRTFTACLLSFMILVAPLASAAATMRRDVQPVVPAKEKSAPDPAPAQPSTIATVTNVATAQPLTNSVTAQPLAPLLPSISATLVDSFPVHPSNKANPGDTISYTATVTNNGLNSPGDDAANVQFNGPLDPLTTYVPGSLHASPIAFNDTYNWVGNTGLDTSAAGLPTVTANDIAITDSFTVTAASGGTSQGGTYNLLANGHFTYTPQAGDTGADLFSYTIVNNADGTLFGTGTVTINLNGRVWYAQNNLVNGDGTSTNPFNSPASASTAANQATDIIYILSDVGANPKLNGNFSLETGQQLLGQGVALVVSAITLFPAGAAPTTTNTAGNGITLNSTSGTNTVRGLVVGDTSGIDINGTNFGTLTLNSVTLNGTGRPLSLDTGAVTATFDNITATSAPGGQGINLAGLTGTLTVTGGTSITNAGTQGILVGTTTAAVNFGNTIISGGTNGVSFQNNSAGTRTFATLSITNSTGAANPAFLHGVGGGPVTVTGALTITNPAGTGIDIQDSNANLIFGGTTIDKSAVGNVGTGIFLDDNATRSITFSSLGITTNSGAGVIATDGGILTVTNAAGSSINSTGGPALDLIGMTLDLDFTTLTSTNSATRGISVDTSTGTLTVNNGAGLSTSVQNSTGRGIHLNNSGTFSFGNTQVNGAADISVIIAGSGTSTFGDFDVAPDSGVAALVTNSTGTVTTTSGTITTTSAAAVSPSSTPLAMVLDSVTANNVGGGGPGINLTTDSGSLVVNAGSLTGGASAAFAALGGSVGVTYSGGMTQGLGGALISITGGHNGTMTFQTGTLSATNGTGLQFANADGTYNFNGTTTLNGAGVGDTGVDILDDSAGTFNFVAATTITSPTGIAFNVNGNASTSTCNVSYSGNITQANNFAMVNVTNHNTGTITFTGTLNATNGTGLQFSNADSTTSYNFNGTTTLNGGDAGVDIVTGSNGHFTFVNTTTITNPSGTAFNVDGGTGNITYNGTITDDVGRLVAIANTTGGTKLFSGAITDNDDADGTELGVSLTTNTGATITFRGGLIVNATTNAAFAATGGGTLNICDENPCNAGATGALINKLKTTTGTALNVANTNIGAFRLEFNRIDAGVAGTGPTNGIILDTTGSSGGLTVNGSGTTDGSGGTIQRTGEGALFTSTSSLVLKNMNFINANSTNGTCNNVDNASFNSGCRGAISMNTVTTATFNNVNITRTVAAAAVQQGINGRSVSALTITDSTISGYGDNVNENALRLWNTTGTCSITNSTFQNPGEFIADIRNGTGTVTFTFDNVIFDDTDTPAFGAAGLNVSSTGNGTMTVNVDNSTFTKIVNAAFQASAKGTATLNSNLTDSSIDYTTAPTGRAVDIAAQDSATHNFNVMRNTKLYALGGTAIAIYSFGTSTIQGRVQNNTDVRTGGVGSPGTGIFFEPQDNSNGFVDISNNAISRIGSTTASGIRVLAFGTAGTAPEADATIANNTIAIINNGISGGGYDGGRFGVTAQAGSTGTESAKTCVDLTSNSVSAAPVPVNGIDSVAIRSRVGTTTSNLYYEGYTGTVLGTWTAKGNTPAFLSESNAGGAPAPSAPPAGAPYMSVCRAPGNPTALYIPAKNQNDNLAKGDTVHPVGGVGTLVDVSTVTAGVFAVSENHSEVVASVSATETTVVARAAEKAPVAVAPVVNNETVAINKSENALALNATASSNNAAKKSELKSHHATIRRASAKPAPVAVNNSITPLAPLSGETVTLGFGAGGAVPGTLPAGKTVTIKYQATISTTPNAASVSTQGTISGTNFSPAVLTDDPSVGGGADPTVTPIALPDLTIDKTHTGNFQQGQTGATYSITVTNNGEFATFGTVTVTDTLPAGLTATGFSGTGWTCAALPTLSCTRSDALAVLASYDPITLTVDVAGNAAASVNNVANVSGGGDLNGANNSDTDATTIDTAPDLTIDKSHTGDFTQGQVGAQYSIVVTNNGPGAVLAASTVTVTDTLPAGMTATGFSGTGWTCAALPTLSCSRSDALASTVSYDPITLTVDVAGNASTPLINSATVSGGGDNTAGNNTDNDSTNVLTSGAQGIDDQYFTPKDTQLNVPAPGVLANDTGTPAPTAVAIVGGATTGGGTVDLNTDGSFIYTPLTGFTGNDTFTYTATNVNGSDTGTVTITVSDAMYINEVLYDPTGTDAPNEYLEFRGVPNSTIPAGTYFVAIEGDTPDNPGDVQTIIDLSGLTFGTNGFLVLLQQSNTYVPQAGANVVTSTTVGFSGLPGAPFQADAAATDIEHDSVSFMLIQSATAPTLTHDIDANDDATPDGSVYAGWTVLDSIAGLDGLGTDSGYGALTFMMGGGGQTSGTAAPVGFVPIYVGRIGDSTGSTTADWAATGALGGAAPNWTLGSNPEPPSFANKPLNHIGASNFVNLAPVNSVPGAQNVNEDSTLTFNAGNGNLISISDPDAAGDDVKVTLTATNGTFSLSGIGGLAFTTGDGTNDTQMIFTGSITSINTALDGLTFTPTLNFFSPPDATLTILTDDQGNNGDGGAKTDSDSINITVNAVNDPPSFTIAGNPPAVNEDAGPQTVTPFATGMSSGPGESQTLTFNVTVTGTTGNLAFSSAPAIDATSGNLTYTTSADTNGTASVDVTLSDNGGGTDTSAIQSFTITVNAVNDAPSFQIPSNPPAVSEDAGAQTVNPFATSFAPGPVTATDETGQTLVGYTVTQTGTTGNLAFTSGPSIDNAGILTYTPTDNTSGTATYNAVATDNGSGTSPNVNQSAPVSFTITVNGDNDAPVLDNTGNMSLNAINEDVAAASNTGTLVSDIIASAGGDRITDVDAGALEGIAITAANNTNGTWEFSIDGGSIWVPQGSPSVTTARLLASNSNTRVRFLPNANFNGTVNPGITFQAWDQTSGTNGGTGDASVNGGTTAFSTASETASITVNPVNDQPTANAQAVATDEDTPLGITLTGSDVETAPGSLTFTVTVQPTNGVLSGTAPNLTYTPNSNYNGPDSFQFTVTDTGDGSSGALSSTAATVSITVNAVNDAPVNTVPALQTTPENTALTFSTANSNSISIADVDAGSDEIQVTLTVNGGTVTLSGTSGLTFSPAGPNNDGTADTILTFNGTVTDINAALNGLVFTPAAGFTGPAAIQIFTNDVGNTGSGGVKTDNDVINITVTEGGSIQFSASTYNVNENGGPATITITRTGGSAGTATVLFQTSDGTADSSDYGTVSQTVTFVDGDTSETVNVPITDDPDNEPTQTVNLTLSNVGGSGALGSPSTAILNINNDDAVVFNFSQAAYIVAEDGLHIDITVNRGGDPAAAVSVDYETSDLSGLNNCSVVNGNASDRCDYLPALGTLNFAAAQTSATFRVFVTDDVRLEGPELLTLTLSSPVGGSLGAQATSTLTLTDHVAAVGGPNPIDDNAFFIRTLYLDFLSREPDPVGFANWLNTLNNCPSFNDPTCDKVHVAQSFFHSAEFGERGYFIYRFFDAGLGQRPTYKQFLRGMQQIGSNLSPAQSEAAKMEFINDFMASPEFQAIYAGLLTPAQANAFISQLETTSGTTIPEPLRSQLVNDMATSAKTPAETLRAFMESPAIFNGFYNRGFVSMLYFGYLHRDPDTVGFNTWLTQLNSDNNFRSLTFGFIFSDEYRGRFGG